MSHFPEKHNQQMAHMISIGRHTKSVENDSLSAAGALNMSKAYTQVLANSSPTTQSACTDFDGRDRIFTEDGVLDEVEVWVFEEGSERAPCGGRCTSV